jgi:riboflavin-specific deaminase-like protein
MTAALRPHVTLHFAQSLDGRIGLPRASARFSSREGIALAHQARAEHDAVLVGSRTVHLDDPRLTVRACSGAHPRRVVLATRLALPLSARVFDAAPGVLVLGVDGRADAVARARLEDRGAEVRLVAAGKDGLVSLPEALQEVHAWGVRRLLVEGGARVLTAFLRERLADCATVEIAPVFYGAPALPALDGIGVHAPQGAPSLSDTHVARAGLNIVVRGRLVY